MKTLCGKRGIRLPKKVSKILNGALSSERGIQEAGYVLCSLHFFPPFKQKSHAYKLTRIQVSAQCTDLHLNEPDFILVWAVWDARFLCYQITIPGLSSTLANKWQR